MRSLVLVAAALLSTSTAAARGTGTSGVFGTVKRGPSGPVCIPEQPCTAVARNLTLIFARGGEEVKRVRTDERGRYRVVLRAGVYSVRTAVRSVGKGLEPKQVRVPRGRFRRVDFFFDTGIR